MTALCGGNPSVLKPGVSAKNIIGGGLVSEGLTLVSPWLLPFALMIDAFLYDASTQCLTDPPAQPTFTQADLSNCIGGAFNPNCGSTLAKIKDSILRWLWFQYCDCTVVATPAFNPPVPPIGVSVPIVSTAVGCFTGAFTGTPTQDTTPTSLRPSNFALMPPGARSDLAFGAGQTAQCVTVPVGQYTAVRVSGVVSFPVGATKALVVEANCFDAANTFINNPGFSVAAQAGVAVPFDSTIVIPSTTAHVGLEFAQTNETAPASASATAAWTCAASPTGTPVAPCPPDPSVALLLQQIWQLLQLVQRQSVPFAYLDGPVHAALSGAGSFAVTGILGIRLHLTTVPTSLHADGSTPPYIFDAGWMSILDSNGFVDETRVHAVTQVWLSRLASDATVVGYSFAPGVIATIIEVIREPSST